MVASSDHCLADEKLKVVLARLRASFEALYGQRLVRMMLFGSHARGDAVSGSDIDVLVVLRGAVDPGEEIERTGALTAALSLEQDVVISRLFVSDDRFEHEQSPLLMNVRREGILV